MNTYIIDKAFAEMIVKRNVYKDLGITSSSVRTFRYNLKQGIPISLDTKLRLLQKSGWTQPANTFTRADMISFAKTWHKANEATKALGLEYALEKWESKK